MTTSEATPEAGTPCNEVSIVAGIDKKIISFNRQTTEQLRTAYNQACADDKEQFVFDGQRLVTQYAKYLLEYLEERLT